MALGYDGKLYILAFDHRGSFQKKMFGIEGDPTPEETATIADAKKLIYEGMEKAVEHGLDASTAGVLVDEQCRTSDSDIFAAGDVAIAPNRWIGQRIRLESWQNAQDQAIVAEDLASWRRGSRLKFQLRTGAVQASTLSERNCHAHANRDRIGLLRRVRRRRRTTSRPSLAHAQDALGQRRRFSYDRNRRGHRHDRRT